jgi:hypothetical protein
MIPLFNPRSEQYISPLIFRFIDTLGDLRTGKYSGISCRTLNNSFKLALILWNIIDLDRNKA